MTITGRNPNEPAPILARASALDEGALFGHPRGLGLLCFTEMCQQFSYYGMRAILVLYLINALKWDTRSAANLYGTYTMLVYLTPVIGGFLADRFIGTRRALVVGCVVIALGQFTLGFAGMTAFYMGLGLIVVGNGFFKPSVATMVGQIYGAGDRRRDSGFTIFYVSINAGAALGPLICGYFAQRSRFSWPSGFAVAGVGMLFGLIGYLWGRDKYLPGVGMSPTRTAAALVPAAAPNPEANTVLHGTIGVVLGAALGWSIGGASALGLLMGVVIGPALTISFLGSRGEERQRVTALFIVALFVIVFWTAFALKGSSMNLFADKNTDLNAGSFRIPSSWFQSVNPIFVILFAPLFAWMWTGLGRRRREPSTALKMVLALALLATGFLFMAIGGARADTGVLVSPFWLVAAYTFLTCGELCLSPVGLSYVTKVAPPRFAALLMGVYFLANAAANKIAGAVAAFTPTPGARPQAIAGGVWGIIQALSATNHGFYMIFAVAGFAAAALMLLFVPLLKRLTSRVVL